LRNASIAARRAAAVAVVLEKVAVAARSVLRVGLRRHGDA
jgi:hypothetical protein